MGMVHLVFGSQGAGKSTYSRRLAEQSRGVRFSMDDWMIQLFGPDSPKPLNLGWVMERVQRCEERIWATASEVAQSGGVVVLDLTFMKIEDRSRFVGLAEVIGIPVQTHYVDAPHNLRRSRVLARNVEKGETFSFEVTPAMFDFMEKEFERPTEAELSRAIVFNSN